MRDGFIKVAAGTPQIRVADCRYNAEQIFTLMREADKQGVRVLSPPGKSNIHVLLSSSVG